MPNVAIKLTVKEDKLVMLLIFALIFALTAVMFVRSNLKLGEFFDISRLSFVLEKFTSISFVLFSLLFSLSLALAIMYGKDNARLASLAILPAALIASLPAFFMAGSSFYMLVFLAFALSATVVSLFAAVDEKKTFSAVWGVLGKGLLVVIVFAFLLSYVKASEHKADYVSKSVVSAIAFSPDMQQQVTGLVVGLLDRVDLAGVIGSSPQFSQLPAEQKALLAAIMTQYKGIAIEQLRSTALNLTITEEQARDALNVALEQSTLFRQIYDYFELGIAGAVASGVALLSILFHVLATIFAFALLRLMPE